MAVQFILGRSGSGKTSHCISSIVDELADGVGPLILLVPRQATYQAERAILTDKRISGFSRLGVFSFESLQSGLAGSGFGDSEMFRIGQQMIIQKILAANQNNLKLFSESVKLPGLATRLAKVITELHEYSKTPEDVRQLAEKLKPNDSLTALKFGDIAVVFDEYLKFIEDKKGKFFNEDVLLTEAVKKIPQADFLKGAKLWVDGFSGFTIQQISLLAELLKTSSQSHIALCLDVGKIDIDDPQVEKLEATGLFYETERTYCDLVEIARKCKLDMDKPVVLNEPLRFSSSPVLGHIEANLFGSESEPAIQAGDGVKIAAAANKRAEVGYAAREIVKLVREKSHRFCDIAVIASDISFYQHYIEAVFGDYGIPFFIDRPRSLSFHPVAEVISSALGAAMNNFATSDCLGYLKTDLAAVTREEVDMLENYCLAFGIDGNDWTSEKEWAFAEKDDTEFNEQSINDIRRRAAGYLIKLRYNLFSGDNNNLITSVQFERVVFDFLSESGVQDKLSQWAGQGRAGGESEHLQFYDKLVNIFDEIVDIFGDDLMAVEEFALILSNAFSKLTLKLIPPKLDQVLVGSIERSRHPNLKTVFLVGTSQKNFPAPVSFDPLLTDEDRNAAMENEFILADGLESSLAARQYFAYIAFTRPSQRLYITYPLMDDSGSAIVRSGFINNLQSLFVDLSEIYPSGIDDDIEGVLSRAVLGDFLCDKLGKDSDADQRQVDELSAVLGGMCEDKSLMETGLLVRNSLDYRNEAVLDGGIVKELFCKSLDCSATRLSSFAACAYQHFARYTLGLRERKLFSFERVDLGRFYHNLLDNLFKSLKGQGKDFGTACDEELQRLCGERIAACIEKDTFISNFAKRCAHNRFIIESAGDVITDCVLGLAKMARAGSLRQIGSEVLFSKNNEGVQLKLAAGDGRCVNLNGRIDRVDCVNIDGQSVAVVFDYKRGSMSVSWPRLYYGLDMQLPLYMLAMAGGRIEGQTIDAAAGAFYIPIETPAVKTSLDDIGRQKEKFGYKAKGIFNGDFSEALDSNASGSSMFYNFRILKKDESPYSDYGRSGALRPGDFDCVLDFTKARIVELAEGIFAGIIDIAPYRLGGQSPCSNCSYNSVCRFDWQINDYNLLSPMNKQSVLDAAGGGHDD